MFGWRKAITRYHYHEKNDTYALCNHASYFDITYKKLVFLIEAEIEPDMDICHTCYELRKQKVKDKIIKQYQERKGHWDSSKVCPECKTPVIFYNSGTKDEHHCTICDKMVVLA